MKKILEGLGIGALGLLGCVVYLILTFISAVLTVIVLSSIYNLIF